jgi:hypothetical protein
MEGPHTLAAEHVVGEPGLALLQNFAHAADRDQASFQRGFQAQVDGIVSLAKILAALGVADDDVGDSQGQQLRG